MSKMLPAASNCLLCNRICYTISANTRSAAKGLERKSLLNAQIGVIFLLRKLLEVPKSFCEGLLLETGNPDGWISKCTECTALVDTVHNTFKKITKHQNKFDDLKTEIYQTLANSKRTKCQNPGTQRKTDEIRNFLFDNLGQNSYFVQDNSDVVMEVDPTDEIDDATDWMPVTVEDESEQPFFKTLVERCNSISTPSSAQKATMFPENNCLLCYRNTLSANSGPERKSLPDDHVPAIFVLRKLLKIPKSFCEKLLLEMGNPDGWITNCKQCTNLVAKAHTSFKKITNLQNKFEELRNNIYQTMAKSRAAKYQNTGNQRKNNEIRSIVFVSENHRINGNEYYAKFVNSTNFQEQIKYLRAAIPFYHKAFDTAVSSKDSSSAAKNSGTVAMKLAAVLTEIRGTPDEITAQYQEAVKFLSRATTLRKSCNCDCENKTWIKNITETYAKCVQFSLQHIKNKLPKVERAGSFEQLIQVMSEDSYKAKFYWEIANLTFQDGVVALATKNFKAALNVFQDCQRPILEWKRFLYSARIEDISYLRKELSVIEDDINFHMATAVSLQAIQIGDDLLKVATEESDKLSMNLVYDVVDWYRKAVIGAREIEVEVEAIVLSRLGCLYDSVLKMKYKAKEYFLRCMQLGVSLFPKNTKTEVWFIKCMAALKRYQDEAVKTDDAALQAEKQKYLNELTKELRQLREANDNGEPSLDLVQFVYKTFPPKDPKHKIFVSDEGSESPDQVKKILLKAILHYHPDKQDVEAHGKKWQILCGEITKILTGRYECFKI